MEKFKDRKPMDTVNKIKGILEKIGIETEVEWVAAGIDNCYSNRVSIKGSGIGSNGKGTSKEFCLASGYAELMERLQNKLMSLMLMNKEIQEETGCILFKDEVEITFDEIIAQNKDSIKQLADIFINDSSSHIMMSQSKMDCSDEATLKKFLKFCSYNPDWSNGDEETMLCVPFYSTKEKKVICFPLDLNYLFYGSNGMAAGNTIEEAYVQALSEVVERHCHRLIYTQELRPPRLPESIIEKYDYIKEMVDEIKSTGNYDVEFYDCSMNGKFPVIMSIIKDNRDGDYVIRLGAHPSMKIAIERTLTESFQGVSMDNIKVKACHSVFEGKIEAAFSKENERNLYKTGGGIYPTSLFIKEPNYEFYDWSERIEKQSNKEMLEDYTKIFSDMGADVLLRDLSYLGFPTCFVIVPGISELFRIDPLEARTRKTILSNSRTFKKGLENFTEKEYKKLLYIMQIKTQSQLENNMNYITNSNIKERPEKGLSFFYIYMVLLNMFDREKEAYQIGTAVGQSQATEIMNAFTYGLKLKINGMDKEAVGQMITYLFKKEIAGKAINSIYEPKEFFKEIPFTNKCHDCENCENEGNCDYLIFKDMMKAISKIEEKNIIDQSDNQFLF
jgi:ribosomal protein S12 methylthiotransferase accessory factor